MCEECTELRRKVRTLEERLQMRRFLAYGARRPRRNAKANYTIKQCEDCGADFLPTGSKAKYCERHR